MNKHQEQQLGSAMARQAKKDGHAAALPKGDNKPTRREIALCDARNAKIVLDVILSDAPNALTTTGIQKRLSEMPGKNISYDRMLRALKQLKALGKIHSEIRANLKYYEIPFKPSGDAETNTATPFFETARANR